MLKVIYDKIDVYEFTVTDLGSAFGTYVKLHKDEINKLEKG